MPVESQEERTVEVLGLPEGVDEELLFLYFENKRRSGGGPLLSVEKKDDQALLVFEEAEVAASVLSKGHHVLHNVELTLRKSASKDKCRLLLRGLNPDTEIDMIELYVENLMGLDVEDYTLHRSPGKDVALIHLSQPFTKDFQNLCSKISSRSLDGSKVTLEQIEQTDSVLVENLPPGTTTDMLTLYFESKRGGNQKVKGVTMLSENTAKVSFVDFDAVAPVLDHPHKLDSTDLVVKPYFDFLQPTESIMPLNSETESEDITDKTPEKLSDIQMPTSSSTVDNHSSQMALDPPADCEAVEEMAEETMEDHAEETDTLAIHIAVPDTLQLSLFQLSTFQDIKKAYPDFHIQIKDCGVHFAGPDKVRLEQLKQTILECLDGMAVKHLTFDPVKAQFLAKEDVKDRLLQAMTQSGLLAVYAVSDCNVMVTSVSQNLVNQACSFLESQLCELNIPVNKEYECMLYIREWSEFLQALGLTSVRVSEQGGNINVLTLKGLENEKLTDILKFLSTPIERETVLSMEPGMLKYIQIHVHQLLADMDQVSIFPLEAEDVCGLKIHGNAAACQMAEEVLQGVVSSICTRTITVNAPGVARFLLEEECRSILNEMQTKFQVYISPKSVHWEHLQYQDIFEAAWKAMAQKNFQKVSLDESAQSANSDSSSHNGAPNRGLLEEAKRIVSAIDERMEEDQSNSDKLDDLDNMDLYTAEQPTSLSEQDNDVILVDASQSSAEGNATSGLQSSSDEAIYLSPCDLEEQAQLSLAIQYSLESSNWSMADEEEQLQKALELSKKIIQDVGPSNNSDQSCRAEQPKKGIHNSLQPAIEAANTIQLFVFAGYTCDLIRVDIAFGKKVSQRQVEEKLEHRSVKNMSEFHKMCVEMIKRKHAVEIQVQGTIITVSGFNSYVVEAMPDVKQLLEKISSTVSDCEILKVIQWVRHNPASSTATPYSPELIAFIENAWKMKHKKVDLLLDSQPHIINFEKMEEHNTVSGKSVRISRRLVNLGDMNEDLSEGEYSLLSHLPEATKVDEDSDEFQEVVKSFYETIQEYHSKIRIIQVEKLMNQLLYNQYRLKKASIMQHATCSEVERTLYHGTSETSVKEISIHGFNRSFCGKNATVYGQGVYFAVNSALSVQDQYSPPNADGYKFIFVSKVLTGDYTKGCHEMKTTPLKESSNIPLRYDSVTDNITKPSMFVIFNDTQAYPEYLITCQRIHR